jgi:hypothetical protein
MRKYIFLVMGMLTAIFAFSQSAIFPENFDGNTISFTSSPASAWKIDTSYYASPPNAYLGTVPNATGVTTTLETPVYDLSNYTHVILRFKHICKISSRDIARIEYKISGQVWSVIPAYAYIGNPASYLSTGFNATSYPEWRDNDSVALPNQSWWKEDVFDVGFLVGLDNAVQFRFVIQHGNTPGTQISYGWLLDDIEISASQTELTPSSVEFVSPFVGDTVYHTGPHAIRAKVKSQTIFPLQTPWLVYTATVNGTSFTDSMLMQADGDDFWKGIIPKFVSGSMVNYSITARDSVSNYTTIQSGYYIKNMPGILTGYPISNAVYYAPEDTTGTTIANQYIVIYTRGPGSYSRTLYLNSELSGDTNSADPLFIEKIAWYNRSSNYTTTRTAVEIYMETTTATSNPNTYINPVQTEAVLVYSGPVTATLLWNEVILHTPFVLPSGSNLMLYIEDKTDMTTSSPINWAGRTVANRTVYRTTGDITAATMSPLIRFSVAPSGSFGAHSAALTSILSPVQGRALGGNTTPISVTLHNRGDSNLTSATIYWSVNGNIQSYSWTGDLPWDFETQVTIGSYVPSLLSDDSLQIWVDMPNGMIDIVSMDDTLFVNTIGCSTLLSGICTVGNSGMFQTVNDAITTFSSCTPSSDVVLALESGSYTENWNLSNLSKIMGGHTLTITSLANHRDSVILYPVSSTGITLANTHNLVLKAITIDVSAGIANKGIEFTASCTNIVIRDCNILAHPTTSSNASAPIYKAASTGVLDSIFIINNTLDGGYYNCYLYGGFGTGFGQMGTHIVFDSNTLTNPYWYGLYSYYTDFNSCSYNKILNSISKSYWQGIYLYESNGKLIIGNQIIQRRNTNVITGGINFYYFNYYNTSDTALVANNEIRIASNNPYQGIYVRIRSRVKLLHNSIYVGGTGVGRGIQIDNNVDNAVEIKNNNIIMESAGSFPIYLNSINNLNCYDIDYNNIYAPQYIGYANGNIASMQLWRQIFTTDKHSVRILTKFADPTVSLEPLQDSGLFCPALPLVTQDIRGILRTGAAIKGCYEITPANIDGMLEQIVGLREGFLVGQTDSVKVIIYNTGATPLTSVNLGWSVNGSSQTVTNHLVSLARGQFDTITVGQIVYSAGMNVVKVWINSGNSGLLMDGYAGDDTLSASVYICTGSYSGTLTIGNGGDFPDIETAYKALSVCGASGDITLAFLSGTHNGELELKNSAVLLGNHSLTLTSSTGDASGTIFASTSTAVNCDNTRNLTIKNLTIDVRNGSYGVRFTGPCSNITIDSCTILANLTASLENYVGIYKAQNTDSLSDFRISNSIIDGGYYGISLFGTSNTEDIYIVNNSMSNQSYYAINIYNLPAVNISDNTIQTQSGYTQLTWRAIYLIGGGGKITSNRIRANNPGITSIITGIDANTSNFPALIANNDIYIQANTQSVATGIYITNPRSVSIIHNSVYVKKNTNVSTTQALYNVILSAGYSSVVKNNILYAEGGAAATTYAFYYYGTAANYAANGASYDIDYNNYYSSGTNIGYVTGADRANLNAYRAAVPLYDSNSVSILPAFVNPALSLALTNYSLGLSCPRHADAIDDILHIQRQENTSMGAYTESSNGQDLMLSELFEWNNEVLDKQKVAVNVTAISGGDIPVTTATFGWSLNGVTQPSVSWTPTSPLNFQEASTVFIGSFQVTTINPLYEVVVWTETINGQQDTVHWNDTLRVSAIVKPLAEFAQPLVPDTIPSPFITVSTIIRTWTGVSNPKMTVVSTVDGSQIIYDTIALVQAGDIWQAIFPQQYYGSKVVYSLALSDTIGNNITLMDSVYIPNLLAVLSNSTWATLSLAEPLTAITVVCTDDYSPVTVSLQNHSTMDYDFSKDTLVISYEIVDPWQTVYRDSIRYTGNIASGTTGMIELIPSLAVLYAGQYDIKVWLSSPSDNMPYDDTLRYTYISNRIALPIDENFSRSILADFNVQADNTPAMWQIIPQGMGADTAVIPVFGNGVLSFVGSRGAMTTLSTRQMDLSQTTQPSLSFWFFHDTIPCDDYTDVRITIDGGTTYNTLFSLTKYNPVYGWKQYSTDLPGYAINQCVALVFEAMEKSNGNVTQYIDRILITARQDIAISEIITSELIACNLKNKEVKVVLSNLTDPILDFTTTPTTLTLEIKEIGQTFTHVLDRGSLGSFVSDTITVATGVDFTKGTYTVKAYFSSVLDVNRQNDTLVTSIVINPALSVSVYPESSPANCLTGELVVNPTITLYNTGNMDLSNIDMILQVDTGENNPAIYALLKETYTGTIQGGDTATYMFNSSYSVPWNARYDVRTYIYLSCDSALVNNTNMVQECVDIKDLRVISIDNPSVTVTKDAVGSSIPVMVTLNNRSDGDVFTDIPVNVRITNSQGVEQETFMEPQTVGASATVSHVFTRTYTVPNDTVYYLTVFVNSQDNYRDNDTLTMKRYTESVGIETLKSIGGFTLYQNIPNPANNGTHIDYSIPENGEVVFNLHSVSGQLLYSRTIETASGKQSIELNTSAFAAGIYFYSIEYKGQRLVKRMMISD